MIKNFLLVEPRVLAVFRNPAEKHQLPQLKKFRKHIYAALAFLTQSQVQCIAQDVNNAFAALPLTDESILLWNFLARSLVDSRLPIQKAQLTELYASLRNGLSDEQQAEVQRLIQHQSDMRFRLDASKAAHIAHKDAKKQRNIERNAEAKRQREEAERLAAIALHKEQDEFKPALKERFTQGNVTFLEFERLANKYSQLYSEKAITLAAAVRDHGMSKENRAQIEEEKDRIKEAKAQALAVQREKEAKEYEARKKQNAWERSLIFTTEIPALLKITQTEYKRWLDVGLLKPSRMREFRKWGKSLEAPLFDPVYLNAITPEIIDTWREADKAKACVNRKKGAVRAAGKAQKTRAIKDDLALHDYAHEFAAARCMKRQFHLCLGPTNSGKTYRAMQALQQAETGVYLAPLRLLALENYEVLKAAGVKVNLITGEERIITPGATHVCSTIEMCDFATNYAVAVIDEIQMLADAQRGSAWVSAVLGVAAEQVFVCGAMHSENAMLELLGETNDPFDKHTFERLTPLIIEDKPMAQVQEGDAIIAFSRKEVLNLAQYYRNKGMKASVIYGALSPEVRRRQAQAFITGKTQILVATDAVGLGLNLPISRVVFSETRKFNGERMVDLSPQEVQQIAGRAGRFGQKMEGRVTAFTQEALRFIAYSLSQNVPQLSSPFNVRPTLQHVKTILAHQQSQNVQQAFQKFGELNFKGKFQTADLTDAVLRLDECDSRLSVADAFSLAQCPADPKKDDDMALLSAFSDVLLTTNTYLLVPEPLFALEGKPSAYLLQQAEAYSRQLAIYTWFAMKHPEFAAVEGLDQVRSKLTDLIDKCLLQNVAEYVQQRRKRRNWFEDADEWDEDED